MPTVPNGPDAEPQDSSDPQPTAFTPDPYGKADQPDYIGRGPGLEQPIDYVPPWALTRAPGTRETIAPEQLIPIDPWLPGIALLNANQLAMLNRESFARQAAAQYIDSEREI